MRLRGGLYLRESVMGKLGIFGAALAFAALLFNTSIASASDQTNLLDQAAATIGHMKGDPSFGPARNMMPNAKGILVIPKLVKGGFVFGAEGGSGVLMKKNGNTWSAPAFYSMGSASFGLQAGLQQAEIVMVIMTDRGLDQITRSEFKVGAGAGITMVTLSAGAQANLAADIIVWTSGTGLYGGLTLEGSVIKGRDDWNRAFYGKQVPVNDILADKVRPPSANPAAQQLAQLSP
jgi:lipid-binding SYLF domain-containing protein